MILKFNTIIYLNTLILNSNPLSYLFFDSKSIVAKFFKWKKIVVSQTYKNGKEKTDKTEEQFAAVEETLTRTEQWVENNQKAHFYYCVWHGAVIFYLTSGKFYVESINEEAQAELFKCVNYFESDSFNLALNDINSEYSP